MKKILSVFALMASAVVQPYYFKKIDHRRIDAVLSRIDQTCEECGGDCSQGAGVFRNQKTCIDLRKEQSVVAKVFAGLKK